MEIDNFTNVNAGLDIGGRKGRVNRKFYFIFEKRTCIKINMLCPFYFYFLMFQVIRIYTMK